jgi:hypothetical protein
MLAQEFTIKSTAIEDKINQLLPSQGGFQPGVDFSASTMVIPIVDLTETAEGSTVREDLQTALSFSNTTFQETISTTDTPITTTGYWSLLINSTITGNNANYINTRIEVTDGVTDKTIFRHNFPITSGSVSISQKLIIKLSAGESIKQSTNNGQAIIDVTYRQVADLNGNLIDP